MSPLPTAALAWYVTGRFYRGHDGRLADYGYFLHLAGIDGPLFDPARGEASAHFTFAATPFLPTPVHNGALGLALDPVGDFSVYLQDTPAARFDVPASFAAGQRIATFRRSSVVVGATVSAGAGAAAPALVTSNVFSAQLIDSVPFRFGGVRHDLRERLGRGVTQFGTAAGTAVVPPPAGYDLAVPFAGSALALGA